MQVYECVSVWGVYVARLGSVAGSGWLSSQRVGSVYLAMLLARRGMSWLSLALALAHRAGRRELDTQIDTLIQAHGNRSSV